MATGAVPTLPEVRARLRPPTSEPTAHRVQVFAAEPDRIQVTWGALGPGPVRVRAADTVVDVVTDGGAGAVDLVDLPSATDLHVDLVGEGVPGHHLRLQARTLRPPPGEELHRFATISDLHIGETTFGYLHTIVDDEPGDPHPVRCTRAALAEARAWGARRVVVKGDVVDQSHAAPWRTAGELLAAAHLPVDVIPGNHEKKSKRTVDPHEALDRLGLDVIDGLRWHDLPALRLVLLDSAQFGNDRGRVSHVGEQLLAALADAAGPGFVAMHHHVQRGPVPAVWPLGVPRGEGRSLLDAVAATNPATFLSAGHVHRNRRWHHGPLVFTTVGSVKDHPGVWAGYVVHEGGIRQVVRRVAAPSAIRWTERSGDALFGAYRHWTPGTLRSRSFSWAWPRTI